MTQPVPPKATYVNADCVRVWRDKAQPLTASNLLVQLLWGDQLVSAAPDGDFTRVELDGTRVGWVKGSLPTSEVPPLSIVFVDVGQGDSCLVTTPGGQRILVDAGEHQMAARYLAARFAAETNAGRDVVLDAIVVSHGDADHVDGVAELVDAAKETRPGKRIRVVVKRVFHCGLVKRPTRRADGTDRPDIEFFGATGATSEGTPVVTDVVDDVRAVADADLNAPFRRFRDALVELATRGPLSVERLDATKVNAFEFVSGACVEVLGPRPQQVGSRPALELLGDGPGAAPTAAGTVNGNSIVLRVSIGRVNVLLTGDATEGTQEMLLHDHDSGDINLRAHVLKVPHHGGEGVTLKFLNAAKPIVSIISAGDEDARRDYLHPRANVVSRLGRSGDTDVDPVIFVTNLAAFDRWVGPSFPAKKDASGAWVPDTSDGPFYARERTRYGAIHVRSDGRRLLVARFGARREQREAYAFEVDDAGVARNVTVRVL